MGAFLQANYKRLKCKSLFNEESISAACGPCLSGVGFWEHNLWTSSSQSLLYFPLFALGDLYSPLYPSIEHIDYFKFTYREQRASFIFILMTSTVLWPNLSISEGHL